MTLILLFSTRTLRGYFFYIYILGSLYSITCYLNILPEAQCLAYLFQMLMFGC